MELRALVELTDVKLQHGLGTRQIVPGHAGTPTWFRTQLQRHFRVQQARPYHAQIQSTGPLANLVPLPGKLDFRPHEVHSAEGDTGHAGDVESAKLRKSFGKASEQFKPTWRDASPVQLRVVHELVRSLHRLVHCQDEFEGVIGHHLGIVALGRVIQRALREIG